MVRTSAPDSVGGMFVDRNPGTSTPGTQIVAADLNMHQEELANIVEGSGLTLSGSDDGQIYKAVCALLYAPGLYFESALAKAASVYFPCQRIDDADHDVTIAHWPDLVPALRAEKLKAGSTTDFSVTVAGSVITFSSGGDNDKLLTALLEEKEVHGSYSNWLSINIAGTDYVITNVNPAAHTVTVTGTPSSGAQTAIVYPYHIAGTSASARIRKHQGRALISHGDPDGECIAGLRRRDRMQGHKHTFKISNAGSSTGAQITSASSLDYGQNNLGARVEEPITDGTNGTPRVGETTDPRATVVYCYMGGGRYIP